MDAITAIRQQNGEPNAVILNATIAGVLGKLQDTTHQPLNAPADVAALRRIVSNQLPQTETQGSASTCSSSYVGDFSQMVYGNRLDVKIVTGPYGTGTFAKRQLLIMAYARLDVAILRPNWFARIKGLKAS
jgi:HK97 family phage major capsid protein